MTLDRSPERSKNKRRNSMEILLNENTAVQSPPPSRSPNTIIAEQNARIAALEDQLARLSTASSPPSNSESNSLQDTPMDAFPPTILPTPARNFVNASNPQDNSKYLEPKINNVPTFDGSRSESETFIISCNNVFSQQSQRYSSDSTKIAYAKSYLTGDARRWILPFERKNLREQKPLRIFTNWPFFVSEFTEQFGIPNSRQLAVVKLKKLSQKGRSISTYVSELCELETELDDYSESTLKDCLIAGLDDYYLDKLQYIKTPDSLRELKILLLEFESRKEILDLQRHDRQPAINRKVSFAAFNRTPTLDSRFQSKSSPIPQDRSFQKVSSGTGGPPNTYRGTDGLNHITDDERRNRILAGTCTYCNTVGHFVGHCPNTPQAQKNSNDKKPPDKRSPNARLTDTEKNNVKLYMAHLEECGMDDVDRIDLIEMDTDSSSDDGLNKSNLACVVDVNSVNDHSPVIIHSIFAYTPTSSTKVFSQLFCSIEIHDKKLNH
jgi:hypothetical protein